MQGTEAGHPLAPRVWSGTVLQKDGPFFRAVLLQEPPLTADAVRPHTQELRKTMGRELRDQGLLYGLVTVIVTLCLPVVAYLS